MTPYPLCFFVCEVVCGVLCGFLGGSGVGRFLGLHVDLIDNQAFSGVLDVDRG